MKTLISVFFIAICTCYRLLAGTIDPGIPDTKYLEFGQKFYCVFSLVGDTNDGHKFNASCVVIDPHHLITAAHVVENIKSCYVVINEKQIEINTIRIHPQFAPKSFGDCDIAIGYSTTDFGLDGYPTLYTGSDEINSVCAIAGYGGTGTFNTGVVKYDGRLRAGSNRVDGIMKDLLLCNPSHSNTGDHTLLEIFIGGGDSGGGLFINGELAGIHSGIMVGGRSPSSKYGEESGHTRISKFVDWINESKTKVD